MTFKQFAEGLISIGNTVVIPVIFTLAGFVFVYGVVKFFFLQGDSEVDRAKGRQFVLWGILGLVLLFSIWGVVNILLSTFGFSS